MHPPILKAFNSDIKDDAHSKAQTEKLTVKSSQGNSKKEKQ